MSINDIPLSEFKEHSQQLADSLLAQGDDESMLVVRDASEWIEIASQRPVPKMLFGEFWYENEVCILFADTNQGKSILAVQIGNSVSRGEAIPGFGLEAHAQPVLYLDFELSDKQFENRYSGNFEDHYPWHRNFKRAEMNPQLLVAAADFEARLNASIEQAVADTGAKVLIVDNITYIKNETEKAKDALPLMKHFKNLKTKYRLSILILAHTPKRDMSRPITNNDLQGSKMLINFCDSAFAIGASTEHITWKYIKQIKARNTEILYHGDNVCLCAITKPRNFLHFEFMNYANERDHLKAESEDTRNQLEIDIRHVMEAEPGLTTYKIAQKLCTDMGKFSSFYVKVKRLIARMGRT